MLKPWDLFRPRRTEEQKRRRRATGLEISNAMNAALKEFIFHTGQSDSAAMLGMKLELQDLFLKYLNASQSLQIRGEIAVFDQEHGLLIER